MSLLGVILGSFFQLGLTGLAFMLAAFNGAALYPHASPFKQWVLDKALFLLPASCLFSASVVIYLYTKDASTRSYWWHSLPVVLIIAYIKWSK